MKPSILSKIWLAKELVAERKYYKYMVEQIDFCSSNKEKLYVNYSKLCDDKKWKYTRAMLEPLKTLNKTINEKILKPYDKELPLYIYGGVSGKSHIWAAFVHSKFKYPRSYIILDFSTYFEQITEKDVIDSLQKLWICNKSTAKIIAHLGCVSKWKEIKDNGEKVVARWFSTSSRLAIFSTLKFFKNLNHLLHKELKGKKHEISVFVDDITISFDNISETEILKLLEKIEKLFKKEWFNFNNEKTHWEHNTDSIEILWILVERWNIDVTKEFKKEINNWYRNIALSKTQAERSKNYRKTKGKQQYKKDVRSYNKITL